MLRIGDLASRTGTSAHTIRYYERVGLLPRAERSPAGYRLYPDDAIRRVRLVRALRTLGFRVRELRSLAGVLDRRFPRAAMRTRLRAKRDEVDARLRELAHARKLLDALQACRCGGDCALVARFLDAGSSTKPSSRRSTDARGPARRRVR
jgi:MerR family transcriptional regulator, copper efflux regulator